MKINNNNRNSNEEKIKYLYYLHGTSCESPEDMESFFNEGIKNFYRISMESILYPIKITEKNNLDTIVKKYLIKEPDWKTIYIIKIPRDFMGMVRHRDGKIDIPIPLLKEEEKHNYTIFTPHLIEKAYNKSIRDYIINPNFCPVFNPSGLKYAQEQIYFLNRLKADDWYQFALTRNEMNYKQLKQIDERHKNFDRIIPFYEEKFGVKKQKKKYVADEYRKQLEVLKGTIKSTKKNKK